MRCPDCRTQIAGNLKACPNCGRRIRRRKNLMPIVIIEGVIILLLVIVLIIVVVKSKNSNTNTLDKVVNEVNIVSDAENSIMEDTENIMNDSVEDLSSNELGSQYNPYSLGDKIELNNIYSSFSDVEIDKASISLDNYSPSNYTFDVNVSLGKFSKNQAIRTFDDGYIFLRFVDSQYNNMGFAYDSVNKNKLNYADKEPISMNSGATGNTYMFGKKEDMIVEPAYIVVITIDRNNNETWNWVKLQ